MVVLHLRLKLNVIVAGLLAMITGVYAPSVEAREITVRSSSLLKSEFVSKNVTSTANPSWEVIQRLKSANNKPVLTKVNPSWEVIQRLKSGNNKPVVAKTNPSSELIAKLRTANNKSVVAETNPSWELIQKLRSANNQPITKVKITPLASLINEEMKDKHSSLIVEQKGSSVVLLKEEVRKISLETDSEKNLDYRLEEKPDKAKTLLGTLKLEASRNWNMIAKDDQLTGEVKQDQAPEKPSDSSKPVDANNQNNGDKPAPDPLQELEDLKIPLDSGYRFSPGFTIAVPTGYGADNNTVFIGASYQNRTRFTKKSDGEMGFGIGLGNSATLVGVELSYSLNSFGTSAGSFGDSSGFGTGGFSAKIHRQIANDLAVAIGWNQFLRIEKKVASDYPKNSYYAVATKIFRLRPSIKQAFSRAAVTVGVGGGEFTDFDSQVEAFILGEDPSGIGVFGSLGIRILEPLSAIVEWTGQDLGIGLSIVPFKNLPIVITPAVRDISGAGDGARFIMGVGFGFQL